MVRLCALHAAIGNVEECAQGWCAFWERGGAVVEPGCAIERLGVDVGNLDLVYYLLDLRDVLEGRRRAEEAEAAARRLAQVLPPGISDA